MKKQRNSVGYFSAYYRGCEALLNMWPEIKKQVPEAELSIAYGWQSWVSAEGEDEFYHRMNAKFEELKDQGVTVHDRLSHEDLAKLMMKTEVLAYPTQFEEIFMITAVKANMAGMKIVATDVGALPETAGPNATLIPAARIYTDEYNKKKFIKAVVAALKNPLTEEEIAKQRKWAEQFSWQKVGKQWSEALNEKI